MACGVRHSEGVRMIPCLLETIRRRCQDIFVDLDAARLCQALSAAFSVQYKSLKQWYKYFCCSKREDDLSKKVERSG